MFISLLFIFLKELGFAEVHLVLSKAVGGWKIAFREDEHLASKFFCES